MTFGEQILSFCFPVPHVPMLPTLFHDAVQADKLGSFPAQFVAVKCLLRYPSRFPDTRVPDDG